MHTQHINIILIFAHTRDVGLYRPCLHCLHEKKTDMEQFGKILIVDDNEDVLFALNLLLEPYAEKIKVAVTPDRIEHFMTTFRPDIILLDMNFSRDAISGQEGFDSLKQILSIDPQAVVIFMTAYADTDKAVRAIKAGATDFIPKPWEKEKLLATLSSGMKLRRSRTEINLLKEQVEVLSNATAGGSEEVIVGDSLVMQQVFSTVEKLRDTDANILILGENGTGKDVIARLLYRNSPRYGKPFVTIDLGSIPEQLFESELFGYEKGAFTDARKAKAGRMEVATGGTLFLDEIGNLSLPMQAKLLTAIESVVSVVWEVRRLRPLMCGSSAPPMQTSVGWWTKETSAKTCCIASIPSSSISPLCENVETTSSCWQSISCNAMLANIRKRCVG